MYLLNGSAVGDRNFVGGAEVRPNLPGGGDGLTQPAAQAFHVGHIEVIAVRHHGARIPVGGQKSLDEAVRCVAHSGVPPRRRRCSRRWSRTTVEPSLLNARPVLALPYGNVGSGRTRMVSFTARVAGVDHAHGVGVRVGHIKGLAIGTQFEIARMQPGCRLCGLQAGQQIHERHDPTRRHTPAVDHHMRAGGGRESGRRPWGSARPNRKRRRCCHPAKAPHPTVRCPR